jgi:hypothetical protein
VPEGCARCNPGTRRPHAAVGEPLHQIITAAGWIGQCIFANMRVSCLLLWD